MIYEVNDIDNFVFISINEVPNMSRYHNKTKYKRHKIGTEEYLHSEKGK